jgi:hypothetical protein
MGMHALPPRLEPLAIVESYGTPEFFADGATFIDRGEVMSGIYFVERETVNGIERHEIARIHFPRSKWMAGLAAALVWLRSGMI